MGTVSARILPLGTDLACVLNVDVPEPGWRDKFHIVRDTWAVPCRGRGLGEAAAGAVVGNLPDLLPAS